MKVELQVELNELASAVVGDLRKIETLALVIAQSSENNIVELVKIIDDFVDDREFTIRMYNYFCAAMKDES